MKPRDLIRSCPDLREPERRRLLALDDWVLHKLHTEWTLPRATTARVAAGCRDDPVSFDNVKHYRVVLEGRRDPTQSAEQTAGRRPPPSGEERRRGHLERPRLVPSGMADEMPDPGRAGRPPPGRPTRAATDASASAARPQNVSG
jgi:hypothetical protein